MAGPENQTLRILREIRASMKSMESRIEALDAKVDKRFNGVNERLDSLRQAMTGESVLGRYAVAEVDERLDSIEKRLKALEGRR